LTKLATSSMDAIRIRRRLKGDMAELYKLHTRLSLYSDDAEERCNDYCQRVVLDALNRVHLNKRTETAIDRDDSEIGRFS
jgi:hypothetical protein